MQIVDQVLSPGWGHPELGSGFRSALLFVNELQDECADGWLRAFSAWGSVYDDSTSGPPQMTGSFPQLCGRVVQSSPYPARCTFTWGPTFPAPFAQRLFLGLAHPSQHAKLSGG